MIPLMNWVRNTMGNFLMNIEINKDYAVILVTNSQNNFSGWVISLNENNTTGQRVGSFQGFYDNSYLTEEMLLHWQVDCLIHPNYAEFKDLIDSFTEVLFLNTSCKEPVMINIYSVEWSEGKRKTFGKLFSDEE